MAEFWLGLGANLGDRRATLAEALRRLDAIAESRVLLVSPVFETEPVGPVEQPAFLNLVATFETPLTPVALLAHALAIERALGRVRTERWGPRTLDIDLLYASSGVFRSFDLDIPHPRLCDRAFVLQPLATIVPDALLEGATIREWADRVGSEGVVRIGDLEWRTAR